MPTTPVNGYPYPSLTDAPNGAAQIKALADALEAKQIATDAFLNTLPRGRIFSQLIQTAGPSGLAATETVIDYGAPTLVSGRRYRLFWATDSPFPTGTSWMLRAKYQSGATLTTAGTKFGSRLMQPAPDGGHQWPWNWAEFVAPSSGQFAIGVTLQRSSGASTTSIFGDTDVPRPLYIDDVGL